MITVLSLIKNEADMIESFIRYNSLFADQFVIYDNMSTDNTLEILNALIAEGFAIKVLEDRRVEHSHNDKSTELLKYAQECFPSDFYVFLDGDEIVTPYSLTEPANDVRTTLEHLRKDQIHLLKWRVYVPMDTDLMQEPSPIRRITHYREERCESLYKVVVPGEVVNRYPLRIAMGNHEVFCEQPIERHVEQSLVIAHYPCRSVNQMIAKFANGWVNALASPQTTEGMAFHWKEQFDFILETGEYQYTQLTNTAKQFSTYNPDEPDAIACKFGPAVYAETISLRYPTRSVPPLCSILRNTEVLAKQFRQNLIEMQTLLQKNALLLEQCEKAEPELNAAHQTIKEMQVENANLLNERDEILRSHSWKLTKPLRTIKGFLTH